MSDQNQPTPNQRQIIDQVPGITREESAARDTMQSSGAVLQSTVEVVPVRTGGIVHDVEFKGDPRRVIGHPSNPDNDVTAAYSERS